MEIKKTKDGSSLKLTVSGRLDTLTAPQLESALQLEGVTELVFDLTDLEYVSSAGLRVFLGAQKKMMLQGNMELVGVKPIVREVLDMTGSSAFFTIK